MKKILLSLFLISQIGFADKLKNELSKCSKVKNSVERITCYDKVVSRYNISTQYKIKKATAKNMWNVHETIDPISDAKVIIFSNVATIGTSRYGKKVSLLLRCSSDAEPEFIINWGSYLGSSAKVTSRFDKEKAVTQEWNMSTDSQASFYNSYPSYQYLEGKKYHRRNIEEIISGFIVYNQFVARVVPFGANPIVATFDLSGFTTSINPHRKLCRIKSNKEIKQLEQERLQEINIIKSRELTESEKWNQERGYEY